MESLEKKFDMLVSTLQKKTVDEAQVVYVAAVNPMKPALIIGKEDHLYSVWDGEREHIPHGKIDTGATVSICDLNHSKFLRDIKTVAPIRVRVANGQECIIDKQGKAKLEVNGNSVGTCDVYVADTSEWQAFLLGRDDIRRMYAQME